MPILDVEIVGPMEPELRARLPQAVADAMGELLAAGPRGAWVKVRDLPLSDYAEFGGIEDGVLPVFVTVLKHHHAEGKALAYEIRLLTEEIARACDRPVENVHVLYEASARGRLAFGGKLVE